MENKLELCRKTLFADSLKKGIDFKGYKVYEPIYNKTFVGGFPKIILVKDKVVRISTAEECFEYMDFKKSKN